MGVSGVGKTTVAKGIVDDARLDLRRGRRVPPRGQRREDGGRPPADRRGPVAVAAQHRRLDDRQEIEAGRSAVVTCSALRRVYRDLLREGRPEVVFCHLTADADLIGERMSHRTDHYMPASLLPSQLATLEPLEPDEPGVVVSVDGEAALVVARASRPWPRTSPPPLPPTSLPPLPPPPFSPPPSPPSSSPSPFPPPPPPRARWHGDGPGETRTPPPAARMTSIEVSGPPVDRAEEVLTAGGAGLRRRPAAALRRPPRRAAGGAPDAPASEIAAGGALDFLPETAEVREGDWQVAPAPARPAGPAGRDHRPDRAARWRSTPSTPAPRSGSPTSRTPTPRTGATSSAARSTCTTPSAAPSPSPRPRARSTRSTTPTHLPVIVPRPRGWHLDEQHLTARRAAASSAALVDFGLYFFHNAAELLARGSGPYFYLPKMESPPRGPALERRLHATPRQALGIPHGHGPRDRPDRDDHGGVRDGRDPLRAARPRRRAQRRPLGLPVQHHQELPRRRPGVHPARPQRGHHDARR